MKLHLRIIEADNIPKMDLFGTADPYAVATLTDSNDTDKTEYIKGTYTPKWNKEMSLNVATIAESIVLELKDHDTIGRDDLIGSIKRNIKKFQPGIVNDEWIQLEAPKGVDKEARIHVVSHLALDGMPKFTNIPFQFLKVVVKVISAKDLAKTDIITDSDPYVLVYLRNYPMVKYRTKVVKNNLNPTWDQDFELDLVNQTSDILSLKVMDKDVLVDDEIGSLDIPLGQFGMFDIYEREFDLKPCNKKVKKAGKITLRIQVIPLGVAAWEGGQMAVQFPGPPPDEEYLMRMQQQALEQLTQDQK